MLKLELTDGETTIEGMEYQPMKKISTDLIPGTKVGEFFPKYTTAYFETVQLSVYFC